MRFSYGEFHQEVGCTFDHHEGSGTLYCKTPRFDDIDGQIVALAGYPVECTVAITTDGKNFSESEETFTIYDNSVQLSTISPKSGSVRGGTELTLYIELPDSLAKDLFHLTIGFQPKQTKASASRSRL